MDIKEKELYEVFDKIGVTDYEIHEHPAIFSTKDADEGGLVFPGLNLKNLLIKDKKSQSFFLVILDDHRHMEEKHFREVTGWKKIRFANSDELLQLLQLTPGSVSPFGLIFDSEKKITVVLAKEIADASGDERLNFHPNRNTATLAIKKSDFMKFLDFTGHSIMLEK